MKKLPEYLEYFLEDLLWWEKFFSLKYIFWSFAIYKNNKIFAIYDNSEFYFRQNEFLLKDKSKQFSYKRKWKIIFLPYFLLKEEVLEDKNLLEKYVNYSLFY